eukprot:TRINITY_DN1323_c0_g1_i1.p1 TRINITY_DN1323_c0_g1~~TRINITY_DN1323_c0_g1_i1.p1  ORF type:complete len:453 (-),score=180.00 TRINITY_DN1323_c0_g1_i1:85-1422(-)
MTDPELDTTLHNEKSEAHEDHPSSLRHDGDDGDQDHDHDIDGDGDDDEVEEGENEDDGAPPPGINNVQDRQRCLRIIQPQNEKGAVWKNGFLKFYEIVGEDVWCIISRGSFYYVIVFNVKTGVLDKQRKPYQFEEMPVKLASYDGRIYFSDIRRGLRSIDVSAKGKIKASFVKESKTTYIETTQFCFGKDGTMYTTPEAADHKMFRVYAYQRDPDTKDIWAKKYQTEEVESRISCLQCDVGPNKRLWVGHKQGSIAIHEGEDMIKLFDATKKKRGLICLATDGEFVFGGAHDKRVYKWSGEGEQIKRIFVKQRVQSVGGYKGMWLVGLDDGDIQIRNTLGYLIGVLRTLKKKGNVWDEGGENAFGGDEKDPKKKKPERGVARRIHISEDGKELFTLQPRYRGLLAWDFADIENVPYTGSRETATIHKAMDHKSQPLMKDAACLIS